MICGLKPQIIVLKCKRKDKSALCPFGMLKDPRFLGHRAFNKGRIIFKEIPHVVRNDSFSIYIVEKRVALPPFSLKKHKIKCHSECSEAK